MRAIRFVPAVFLAVLLLIPHQAKAAMLFCNLTKSPIEAAFGYREGLVWTSEGWWRIESGQCARVFGGPLMERYYYYYARALTAPAEDAEPLIWAGKYLLCIDNRSFHIKGEEQCEERGYATQGFHEVDIGAYEQDYKLEFKDGSSSQ